MQIYILVLFKTPYERIIPSKCHGLVMDREGDSTEQRNQKKWVFGKRELNTQV